MRIDRVQIEEGFLDGLDVPFTAGLNVIIGERGTGKTSLIELVRFCLGVRGYTTDSAKRSLNHARSILGSGQVIVTLSDSDHEIIVSRTASDESPRATAQYIRPIIFSQTEIETIGLQAQGRVRLLDSFTSIQKTAENLESAAASEVRSLTAEVESLRREIDELSNQVDEIPILENQISELLPLEKKLSKVSKKANSKKDQLDIISSKISASAVSISAIERFQKSVTNWQSMLTKLSASPPSLESWPEGSGPDPIVRCRERVEKSKEHLGKALRELQDAVSESDSYRKSYNDYRLKYEDLARQLRKEIEELQEGAGTIVRQGQQIRERKAQLESLKNVLKQRRKELKSILARRSEALDQLDFRKHERFSVREEVAKNLTKTLGPRIRIKVSRAGQYNTFAAAIADSLRGSGLRYNELSSTLAENVSPRELLEAVDTNDIDLISDSTGITKERAARALSHLRESDLGSLSTVTVEDAVVLQLLDGTNYKNITRLSTGQRCTVVLPMVLRHTDRVLIVDQPEDHIDNAFITETLIVSILARSQSSQMIFSTHNANIPVLGEADWIIQLGSDGKRGFPILSSNLEDPSVVDAITTVMEGGADAFKQRASFYSHHEKL